MSLTSENVIPGDHGKVFGTNAVKIEDINRIKAALEAIHGVKDVIPNMDVFPREFIVHTSDLVKIKEIEDVVIQTGFHAIPKELFSL